MQIHHNFDYTLGSCKLRTHACWKSGSAGPNDSRALKQFHLTRENWEGKDRGTRGEGQTESVWTMVENYLKYKSLKETLHKKNVSFS